MVIIKIMIPLQRRHNESQIAGVSIVCSAVCSGADQRKYQSSASLGLFEGNPLVTGEFPSQRTSNVENVSFRWRNHDDINSGGIAVRNSDDEYNQHDYVKSAIDPMQVFIAKFVLYHFIVCSLSL